MEILANSKKNKYCAICKHWYDPTNSALKKVAGKNLYKINTGISMPCNIRINKTKALFTCRSFEPKL